MGNLHYICLGECEGVSDKPGVCQAVECDHYNERLVECGCSDGEHMDTIDDEESEIEE